MQKKLIFILCVLIFINVLLALFLRPSGIIDISKYINKIDSLEQHIDSINNIRDSIKLEIDTVYVQLKNNKKHYEEIHNDIINFTVTEDYSFFTEYLEWNKQRLNDSINNIQSTQRS